MSRKKKNTVEKTPMFDDLSPQTKQAIGAVVIGILGIFFLLSLLGFAGRVGGFSELALTKLFGTGAWLAPIACGFYMFAMMRPREDERVSTSKILGISLMFLSLLALLELYQENLGGLAGLALSYPLSFLVGNVVTGILLAGFVLIGIFLTFNTGLSMPKFGKKDTTGLEDIDEDFDLEELDIPEVEEANARNEESGSGEDDDETATKKGLQSLTNKVKETLTKDGDMMVKHFSGPYIPPSLSLLNKDKGKAVAGDVKANSLTIKRTLKEFGINVEMDAVESGPAITRYSLKPAQGVRISRIVALQQELQLALKASTIRIEAPIPGKSLVGIEVPNSVRSTVGLASILRNPEYTDSPRPLLVALGKDVAGGVHFANIARMPHALIAGTTGSGKSVTIHNIIVSLLFRNSPDQLRFILVDPKRVELTLYNGIPHLLTPVITEPKKALKSLSWAVKEMARRYDILQAEGIQGLDLYHSQVYQPAKEEWEANGSPEEERDNLPEPLPYIVIILDELNDLMQAYPRELEALIVRLAQMSRAVGIHLLLATQRPSVNVITGTIKANIPTRIALNVASQIDSRTIIDQMGAEKLLGQGDMLYLSSDSPRLIRIQSAFISGDEIKKVVSYLKAQDADTLDTIDFEETKDGNANSFMASIDGESDDEEDELFDDAKQAVLEAGKASTSYLQRKLRIGYSRAARLIDILEERGIIGPADGSRPREILLGKEEEADDEEKEDHSTHQ
ncbi:MAG: DNA translocase FtsK 4TM domain-containing protein [Candidatus Nomurabacteria bacterium]|nr:DNA translocase FtsK 4TM domain-containing protein [Candidatus Nomurabacteria bacterium]USN88184.1 MAG: DNA translocase FtsK 4TM domain-containing protein [Candidatus Nomurabacteria bacterium]